MAKKQVHWGLGADFFFRVAIAKRPAPTRARKIMTATTIIGFMFFPSPRSVMNRSGLSKEEKSGLPGGLLTPDIPLLWIPVLALRGRLLVTDPTPAF
jgi:hypothetical protein